MEKRALSKREKVLLLILTLMVTAGFMIVFWILPLMTTHDDLSEQLTSLEAAKTQMDLLLPQYDTLEQQLETARQSLNEQLDALDSSPDAEAMMVTYTELAKEHNLTVQNMTVAQAVAVNPSASEATTTEVTYDLQELIEQYKEDVSKGTQSSVSQYQVLKYSQTLTLVASNLTDVNAFIQDVTAQKKTLYVSALSYDANGNVSLTFDLYAIDKIY